MSDKSTGNKGSVSYANKTFTNIEVNGFQATPLLRPTGSTPSQSTGQVKPASPKK
jgi:hypothetical protein